MQGGCPAPDLQRFACHDTMPANRYEEFSGVEYLIYITEHCNLFCRYCEPAGARAMHGRDLGYPDVACMPDGRAVVVYYHNSSAGVPEGGEPAQAPRYIEGCFVEER